MSTELVGVSKAAPLATASGFTLPAVIAASGEKTAERFTAYLENGGMIEHA
jgi:hypothetical protein